MSLFILKLGQPELQHLIAGQRIRRFLQIEKQLRAIDPIQRFTFQNTDVRQRLIERQRQFESLQHFAFFYYGVVKRDLRMRFLVFSEGVGEKIIPAPDGEHFLRRICRRSRRR